jgi:hypothetical protein
MLHLVIQVPPPGEYRHSLQPANATDTCTPCSVLLPDALPRSRRLSTIGPLADKATIQKHVKAAKAKKSPSTGATPSAFPDTQANNPILNGRPFATRSTPVHLYHNVFTTFTSVYNDKTRKIPPDIQKRIFELCHASCELYKTTSGMNGETKRLNAVLPMYSLILGEPMQTLRVVGGEADVAIMTTMSDGQMAPRGIIEGKNEIGAGGCDPNLQGSLSYIKYWSVDEVRVCPTLSTLN